MKKLVSIMFLSLGLYASESIYATFDVESNKEAIISVDAKGVVSKINVDIGDEVKKGDLLLSLDSSDLKSSLDMSKSELVSLDVDIKYAQKSFNRYKNLKGVVNDEAFDKYEYNLELLKAKREQLVSSIAYKQALLNKTVLKAPFNGVITNRFIEEGEVINNKSFTLTNMDNLTLVLSFDEKYWKKVKVGDSFEYRVDGIAEKLTGSISKVYPSVDKKNRTIKAEVIVKDLLPGLFGDGYIKVK